MDVQRRYADGCTVALYAYPSGGLALPTLLPDGTAADAMLWRQGEVAETSGRVRPKRRRQYVRTETAVAYGNELRIHRSR